MNIRRRLLLGFIGIALLVGATAYLTIHLTGHIGKLRTTELPMQQHLRASEVALWEAIHAANAFMVSADTTYKNRYKDEIEKSLEFFNNYAELTNTEVEAQLVRDYILTHKQISEAGDMLLAAVIKEKEAEDAFFEYVDAADDVIDFKIQAEFSPNDPDILPKEQSVREVEVSIWEAIHAGEQYTGLTENISRSNHAQSTFADLMEKQFLDVEEFWAKYKPLIKTPSEIAAAEEFETLWAKAIIAGRTVIQSHQEARDEYNTLYEKATQADLILNDKIDSFINKRVADRDVTGNKIKAITIGMGIFAFLAALIIGILIAHSISSPLEKMKDAAIALGQGDLEARAPETGKGEIGVLATTFNEMVSNLKHTAISQREAEQKLQRAHTKLQEQLAERERAEKEARALRQQMEFILGATNTGLDIIDSDLNIRYIDPEWQKVYGDPTGKKCHEYFMDSDSVCANCGVLKALKTKEIVVAEEFLPKENNRPVQVTTVPFQNDDGEWLVAEVNTDISARKESERAMERYASNLEHANREVREFVYIVSHDLRAPLVNLQGFSGELRLALNTIGTLVKAILPQASEEQRSAINHALNEEIPEATQYIDRAVKDMDRFINAILVLSRIGDRKLNYEPINMNDLVQKTIEGIDESIKACGATVEVSELPNVTADRIAMEQIVKNLLSNAVNYLDPNRLGAIKISGKREMEKTVFRVSDNGRGIAKDDMHKVFAPFRRAGKQTVEGEGMGLAYVQTLVQRHGGGRIKCESVEGVGTTFTFTISNYLEQGDIHG